MITGIPTLLQSVEQARLHRSGNSRQSNRGRQKCPLVLQRLFQPAERFQLRLGPAGADSTTHTEAALRATGRSIAQADALFPDLEVPPLLGTKRVALEVR